jgi:hypothetical protein
VKTITAIAANKLGKFLAKDFRRVFGPAHDDMAERLGSLARSTIECLARSDALYHNYEHTLQVTMVGRDILQGMTLSQRIEPTDYSHLIVACLLHDIGYMRGVLSGDTETEFVVDGSGKKITLPRGASDAALLPYHVDRSKLFAFERLGNSPTIDASRIAAAIEMTRFPARLDRRAHDSIEPKLVQAADLIGDSEVGRRNPDFRSSLHSRHSPTRRSRSESANSGNGQSCSITSSARAGGASTDGADDFDNRA